MAPAQAQGETCCSEAGAPANNSKEKSPAGTPSSASFKPRAELKEPSPGLADDLPKSGHCKLSWDLGKSSPAFSMPYAINGGCAIGKVTGSLAFALCQVEVMSKYLFLLGTGSKHDLEISRN